MEYRKEFDVLIDVLILLVEANANRPTEAGKEHLAHAQLLTIKMFRHRISMANVASGVEIEQQGTVLAHYHDFSTVDVLLRAAIEAHLAFNYIFSPDDEGLVEFRHIAWCYSGLKARLKLKPALEEMKEKQRSTQVGHDGLWERIAASPYFQPLGDHKRRKLKSGAWDFGIGCVGIATEAGFHSAFFHNVYTYCCSHAHSDFVSVFQIESARKLEDQQFLATSGFVAANMILAHHIRIFVKIFPNTMPAYLGDETAVRISEKWYIRAEDM